MKATNTVYGVVVRGTAIESIAKHYCRSYGIPFGNGSPYMVGRVKFIPNQGYVKVDKGRGSFIAVILPPSYHACMCTENNIVHGCSLHDHVEYTRKEAA